MQYVNPVHLGKGHKRGTHRVISPRETLARMQPYLPPMGITRVANVTGLDTIGIPVVMAYRPNSRSLAVSQGKGLDLAAARASAVMESVEGYHAENVELPLKLASYRDLCTRHTVVDTDLLPRCWWHRSFHPDLPLLWVKGEDWLRHEKVWIPFQLVHTRYTAAMRFDLNSFAATSTGLASGNHLLEAASHATCEVVERGPALRVWVVGHTDYVGTAEFNVTLSNARAAAVVKALAAAGIDPKRLTPHGGQESARRTGGPTVGKSKRTGTGTACPPEVDPYILGLPSDQGSGRGLCADIYFSQCCFFPLPRCRCTRQISL